jgi:proteasome lid subunit RPN8/RPN11
MLHKAIALHCLDELPNEACGVVINNKAIKCKNVSESPADSFMISAEDYLTYLPEVIFHSHPSGLKGLSDHDLAVAANMDLTSYVYVVEADRLEKWSADEGITEYRNVLKEK